jgi:hypothetical protein
VLICMLQGMKLRGFQLKDSGNIDINNIKYKELIIIILDKKKFMVTLILVVTILIIYFILTMVLLKKQTMNFDYVYSKCQSVQLVDNDYSYLNTNNSSLKKLTNDDRQTREFRGALVRISSNFTTTHNVTVDVPWDVVVYDTDGFWNVTNPARLTVPDGVSRIRISTNINWGTNTTGRRIVGIHKNDTFFYGRGYDQILSSDYGNTVQNVHSAIVEVSSGDYFTVIVQQLSGTSLSILNATWTSFHIEVID